MNSAYADAVLAIVETEGLHVPELWPREVVNGLAIAGVRKRLTPEAFPQAESTLLDVLSAETHVGRSADAARRNACATSPVVRHASCAAYTLLDVLAAEILGNTRRQECLY